MLHFSNQGNFVMQALSISHTLLSNAEMEL